MSATTPDPWTLRKEANAHRKGRRYAEALTPYAALWAVESARDAWDGWGYAFCLDKTGRTREGARGLPRGVPSGFRASAGPAALCPVCVSPRAQRSRGRSGADAAGSQWSMQARKPGRRICAVCRAGGAHPSDCPQAARAVRRRASVARAPRRGSTLQGALHVRERRENEAGAVGCSALLGAALQGAPRDGQPRGVSCSRRRGAQGRAATP